MIDILPSVKALPGEEPWVTPEKPSAAVVPGRAAQGSAEALPSSRTSAPEGESWAIQPPREAAAPIRTEPVPQASSSAVPAGAAAAPVPAATGFTPGLGASAPSPVPASSGFAPAAAVNVPARAPRRSSLNELDEPVPLDRPKTKKPRRALVAIASASVIIFGFGALWAAGLVPSLGRRSSPELRPANGSAVAGRLAAGVEGERPVEGALAAGREAAASLDFADGTKAEDERGRGPGRRRGDKREPQAKTARGSTTRPDTARGASSAAPPVGSASEKPPASADPAPAPAAGGGKPQGAGASALEQAAAHYRQANSFLAAKKVALAIEELEKCLALDPNYGLAYRSLGVAYMLLGRERSAITAYERFVALEPGHRDAPGARQIIENYKKRQGN